MPTIRPITRAELKTFCQLAENPHQLHERLTGLFEDRMSSPDCCHVLAEDGQFLAGAVYVTFPSSPADFGLWRIFKLTGPRRIATSTQFLLQSFRLLSRFHAKRLEATVSSLDDDAAEQRALFTACGFRILQVKARFEFDPAHSSIDATTSLHLESFEDVGKETFVNLISDVTEGTLDRSQRAEYQRLGGKQWAESFVDLLLTLDPDTSGWRVAMINDQPVGFVIPQIIAPDTGAINYIGVIPAHRGHGISRDLLKVATAELIRAGVHLVIADVDVENHPMANAFTSIGYRKTAELTCYQMEIR